VGPPLICVCARRGGRSTLTAGCVNNFRKTQSRISCLSSNSSRPMPDGGDDVGDLVPSIRIQSLLVRPNCDGYEVVSGGRRLRACQAIAAEEAATDCRSVAARQRPKSAAAA